MRDEPGDWTGPHIMTLEEVIQRVADIQKMVSHGDTVGAHIAEDDLRRDFIACVTMSDSPELADMAKVILMTEELTFSRWYR